MLSLRTNTSALSANRAIDRSSRAGSVAMTRLSTGYRINSAQDDAAGLQIATRLKAQSSGMAVAMRNTQNDISMLQVAEGAVDTIITLFGRMKDLSIQAADGSTTATDKAALQTEFVSLFAEVWHGVETRYNGEDLFISTPPNNYAKLWHPVNMQIGESSASVMSVNLQPALIGTLDSLNYTNADLDVILTQNASQAIANSTDAIDSWAALRSQMGAVSNRLEHVYNNLANISTNTENARGRIVDTDYATETAAATSAQMLTQAGTSMLKESNSLAQLTLSLVT